MDSRQGQVSGNCEEAQGNYLGDAKVLCPDVIFHLHGCIYFWKFTWLYTQNWKIALYIIIPQYKYSKIKIEKIRKEKTKTNICTL